MKILALELSSPLRSVAVTDGARRGYAEEASGRETRPFALVEAALREAGMVREEIECIAVGLGPGSNAGVRTAIAIAQGWQLARGVKLLGLSSAEAVAVDAGKQHALASVVVGIDARAGELFVSRYDVSNVEQPKLMEPFRAASLEEIEAQAFFRMDGLASAAPSQTAAALRPDARTLAALATHRMDYVRGETLEPVPLRPVQFVKAPLPKFTAD